MSSILTHTNMSTERQPPYGFLLFFSDFVIPPLTVNPSVARKQFFRVNKKLIQFSQRRASHELPVGILPQFRGLTDLRRRIMHKMPNLVIRFSPYNMVSRVVRQTKKPLGSLHFYPAGSYPPILWRSFS